MLSKRYKKVTTHAVVVFQICLHTLYYTNKSIRSTRTSEQDMIFHTIVCQISLPSLY